jgi:hypothetical protein
MHVGFIAPRFGRAWILAIALAPSVFCAPLSAATTPAAPTANRAAAEAPKTGRAGKAAHPTVAHAPALRVGDEWTYTVSARDGRSIASSVETRRVTVASPTHVTLRIERKGRGVDIARTESFSSPGVVTSGAACGDETRRFPSGFLRLDFPLRPGKRWSRRVESVTSATGKQGSIHYRASVRHWEKVTTPAGTFDALRVTVLVRLDDADATRQGTECDFTLWYSPSVGATVLEDRRASVTTRGDDPETTQTLDAGYELVSYIAGKR